MLISMISIILRVVPGKKLGLVGTFGNLKLETKPNPQIFLIDKFSAQ